MIIICPHCEKKFTVDKNQIPDKGRLLKCGSCDETWFFSNDKQRDHVNTDIKNIIPAQKIENKKPPIKSFKEVNKTENVNISELPSYKGSDIIKYESKSNFSFIKFLSYILVSIISFVAIIIILDTFKSLFYVYFPSLEAILFNFFETIKDIKLFVKDLI